MPRPPIARPPPTRSLPSATSHGRELRANNGTFNVSVSIRPALHSGHQLQLVLDGKPYGTPSSGTRFTLHEIDRGDHSLAVQVLNGERVLQSSPPVTFTVQRVHLGKKR